MTKRSSSITVVCPRCSEAALAPPLGAVVAKRGPASMSCASCGARYPVGEGILDLLPGSEASRTLAQALMEWEPLVSIYESRLWRRSALFGMLTGISFDDEYEVVKTAASPGNDSRILDLACGSGIYSRRLASACPNGTVVGFDLSLPMLRYASRKARAENVENLRLIRGNALELPFEDSTFEIVNCCGALHLLPDLPRVLDEILRVLAPNGRFTAAVFKREDTRLSERLNDLRRDFIGLNAFTADELAVLYEDAGLRPPELYHDGRIWAVVASSKPSRSRARR